MKVFVQKRESDLPEGTVRPVPRRTRRVLQPPRDPARAVAYVRVSTEEMAREGVSLDAQTARLEAYCALQELQLTGIFRDEGVSGGQPLANRPAGAALLEAIAAGEAANIVAVKLDRLFRDAIDCMQRASEWDDAGVGLHLLDMGGQAVDSRSAAGRFMLHVLAAAAEMERNRTRERTREALAHKKACGDRLGTTPLGFVTPEAGAAMLPDAQELLTVALILEQRAGQGMSFRAIAAELNARGMATKRGGSWHHSTVRLIWERRARYRGVLGPNGGLRQS